MVTSTASPLDLRDLEPGVGTDEGAARATLRTQLRHLERELAQLASDGFRDAGDRRPLVLATDARRRRRGAPHLLSLAELAAERDVLVARVAEVRAHRRARREEIEAARALLEEVQADPARHRFVRIPLADLGEPGCGSYQVRPRLGLIGMLAGWWHIVLSSGCP